LADWIRWAFASSRCSPAKSTAACGSALRPERISRSRSEPRFPDVILPLQPPPGSAFAPARFVPGFDGSGSRTSSESVSARSCGSKEPGRDGLRLSVRILTGFSIGPAGRPRPGSTAMKSASPSRSGAGKRDRPSISKTDLFDQRPGAAEPGDPPTPPGGRRFSLRQIARPDDDPPSSRIGGGRERRAKRYPGGQDDRILGNVL